MDTHVSWGRRELRNDCHKFYLRDISQLFFWWKRQCIILGWTFWKQDRERVLALREKCVYDEDTRTSVHIGTVLNCNKTTRPGGFAVSYIVWSILISVKHKRVFKVKHKYNSLRSDVITDLRCVFPPNGEMRVMQPGIMSMQSAHTHTSATSYSAAQGCSGEKWDLPKTICYC